MRNKKQGYAYQHKPVEELTFTDDFMFGRVLRDKAICKELLETLLDIKIAKISFPEIQKELAASYKSKSIRLDVFVSDPDRNFDIELQVVRHSALPERMRYYQSLMDIDSLLKGRKYHELKENYVIFICMFDPFGEDLPVYFFENTCREKSSVKLGDKSFKVCYNVNASDKTGDKKIKSFLEYVKTRSATDSFTKKLDDAVKAIKDDETFRRDYMMRNIFVDDWIDVGKAEGAHDKAVETARNFLMLGIATQEQIAQATGLSLDEVSSLAQTVAESVCHK